MASESAVEAASNRVLDRFARLAVPSLLAAILGLGGLAYGDLKSLRAEDREAFRTELTAVRSDIATLEQLTRSNYDLIQAQERVIAVMQSVMQALTVDGLDFEQRFRVLEQWRANILARPVAQ